MANKSNDKDNIILLETIDRLIHEPARLVIMAYLLVVKSADFLFLEKQLGLTRGNLSSHLSKLEEAGYIVIKKEFVDKIPRTLIQLSPAGRKAFEIYKNQISTFLQEFQD